MGCGALVVRDVVSRRRKKSARAIPRLPQLLERHCILLRHISVNPLLETLFCQLLLNFQPFHDLIV